MYYIVHCTYVWPLWRCTFHWMPTLNKRLAETRWLDAMFMVDGDFNKGNMRKVLLRHVQHVHCRETAWPRSHLTSMWSFTWHPLLLQPPYRQKLKGDRSVRWTIQHWSEQTQLYRNVSTLWTGVCIYTWLFKHTHWCGDCHIGKCSVQ